MSHFSFISLLTSVFDLEKCLFLLLKVLTKVLVFLFWNAAILGEVEGFHSPTAFLLKPKMQLKYSFHEKKETLFLSSVGNTLGRVKR